MAQELQQCHMPINRIHETPEGHFCLSANMMCRVYLFKLPLSRRVLKQANPYLALRPYPKHVLTFGMQLRFIYCKLEVCTQNLDNLFP